MTTNCDPPFWTGFAQTEEFCAPDPGVQADISTFSAFGVSLQSNGGNNIAAYADSGTRLYQYAGGNSRIYRYNLSTPYDVSTLVYTGDSKSTLAFKPRYGGFFVSPDGTKALALTGDNESPETFYLSEYDLPTPYQLSTMTLNGETNITGLLGSLYGAGQALHIREDGTELFVLDTDNAVIRTLTTTTPWRRAGVALAKTTPLNPNNLIGSGVVPTGLAISPSGLDMVIGNLISVIAYQFRMTSSHDLDSLTGVAQLDVGRGANSIVCRDGPIQFAIPDIGTLHYYEEA